MPLRVRQRTIGFLSLFSETRGFYTEEHAERLVAFASQTATAIENARLYSEVQQKADTDELTGLRNRRSLFELGSREVERAVRFKRPLSVLMIDLDYFKQVNDSFGHQVGDRMLVALAELFRHKLRNVDLIGRYGGDEFIAILPESAIRQSEEIAHRLLSGIESLSIETAQGMAKVSACIGIAEITDAVVTLPALIEQADRALYHAKEAGRSRVVCSESLPN
jgi:diguanylate cyclase (GGDEF)-like protein